jgi:uncharacterized phage protein (TIGR01671 family)
MREIKFRAFIDGEYMVFSDMDKGGHYDEDEIIWNIQGGLQISTLELINEIVGGEADQREAFQIRGGKGDEVHFMQFTGLKDKNGVEIYEGDITKSICGSNVKCYWLHVISSESGIAGNNLYAMEFENNLGNDGDSYTYEVERKKYIRRGHVSSNMIVIGNIHENPELLCAKK